MQVGSSAAFKLDDSYSVVRERLATYVSDEMKRRRSARIMDHVRRMENLFVDSPGTEP